MAGTERRLVYRQHPLEQRSCRGQIALILKEERQAIEARRNIGMLGAERLLADRPPALEERPRRGQIALVPKQTSEVTEALRRTSGSAFRHIRHVRLARERAPDTRHRPRPNPPAPRSRSATASAACSLPPAPSHVERALLRSQYFAQSFVHRRLGRAKLLSTLRSLL